MENNYVPEIYVGENGNWFVNGYDTGTKAQGEPGKDGTSPYIGCNGNWFVGETNTGVAASGPKGDKGDKGNIGPQGLTGLTGPQWVTGPQGLTGPQGSTGATGPQGMIGPKGDTGVAGPQGQTGATGPKGDIGPKGDKGEPGPVKMCDNFEKAIKGEALDATLGSDLNNRVEIINSKFTVAESTFLKGDVYFDIEQTSYLRKVGNKVTAQLIASNTSTGAAYSRYILAKIPVEFRPTQIEVCTALTTKSSTSGFGVAGAQVEPGGNVVIRSEAQFNNAFVKLEWYI